MCNNLKRGLEIQILDTVTLESWMSYRLKATATALIQWQAVPTHSADPILVSPVHAGHEHGYNVLHIKVMGFKNPGVTNFFVKVHAVSQNKASALWERNSLFKNLGKRMFITGRFLSLYLKSLGAFKCSLPSVYCIYTRNQCLVLERF